MSSPLDKMKTFFGIGDKQDLEILNEPQLGFKIFYYPERKSIGIKVIAARNLPTNIGVAKPKGYLVKVKVFPGKEKFETQVLQTNCPCFEEHFMFALGISHLGQLSGKFATFTIYADMEGGTPTQRQPLKKKLSLREQFESFVGGGNTEGETPTRLQKPRRTDSARLTLNNRRTVGAIQFNLDKSIFTERGKGGAYYTPDIWRTITNITSGKVIESRESKKGSLEVIMRYSNSEDGKNDMIQISLSKFRCSMATMQEHEQLGGNLYLKMATHECDVVVSKWKGDTFSPTISMKIAPDSATMINTIHNYNLDKTKIILKLKSRNALQQKTELGTIVIDKNNELFRSVIDNPTMVMSKILDFH